MLFQRARKPWRSRSRRCAISSPNDILDVFFATGRDGRIALRCYRRSAIGNPVDPPFLAGYRDKNEAKLFAHDTGEEAANRMGLPLRCVCHRRNGRTTWRSQHRNDLSLFAFAACSRPRRGRRLLMSRRLCNGLELSRPCAQSSALLCYESWSCCLFALDASLRFDFALVIGISFGCAATIAATTEAPPQRRSRRGRIPKRSKRPRTGRSTALFARRSQSFLDNLIAG